MSQLPYKLANVRKKMGGINYCNFNVIQELLLEDGLILQMHLEEMTKEFKITLFVREVTENRPCIILNNCVEKTNNFQANWIRIFRTRSFLTAFALGFDMTPLETKDNGDKDEDEILGTDVELEMSTISIAEANAVLTMYYNNKANEDKSKLKKEKPNTQESSIVKSEKEFMQDMVKEESKIIMN